MSECSCMVPPFNYQEFDSEYVGRDETNGRFADVSIETCKKCGKKWLRYFVEYEAFTASGRWYRGLVSDDVAKTVTPETAVSILEGLEYRFSGGSYFRSTGQKSVGSLKVDL